MGTVDNDLETRVMEIPRRSPRVILDSTWRYLELRSDPLFPSQDSKLDPTMRSTLLGLIESYEMPERVSSASPALLSRGGE